MSDFDEYLRQGEPGRSAKVAAWRTAIGLQDVDGLKPSAYLVDTAKRHIEGDITIDQVKGLIDAYYKSKLGRSSAEEERTEEADKVSARITELLQEDTFSFAPAEYQRIHRNLFEGIFESAGKYRDYNITKREWVLDGDSVLYNPFENLKETLDFDFAEERKFDYASVSTEDAVRQIAAFIAGVWQIHPFGEGNTRTTAVFLIKYLRSFGFSINNDLFAAHSWYFRNALVRANYNNFSKGISATDRFLVLFLRNLILGENNSLSNRKMHIFAQSINPASPKGQIGTLNITLEERAVLNCISQNNRIIQKEIALAIGKSERTVKRIMASLSEKGIIIRRNGKRNGYWEVMHG